MNYQQPIIDTQLRQEIFDMIKSEVQKHTIRTEDENSLIEAIVQKTQGWLKQKFAQAPPNSM